MTMEAFLIYSGWITNWCENSWVKRNSNYNDYSGVDTVSAYKQALSDIDQTKFNQDYKGLPILKRVGR